MPRGIDDHYIEIRLSLKGNPAFLCHIGDVFKANRLSKLCGKVPDRIFAVVAAMFPHDDRNIQCFLQFVHGTDVVGMTMRQKNLFNRKVFLANQFQKFFCLCAGVN